MVYLFYRVESDGGPGAVRDNDDKALARAVDYDVRALARAVEKQYADPSGDFNVRRLDGAETPWNDVVVACGALPFLAAHQVVRLSGLIGASAQRRARSGDDPAKAGISPDGLAELVATLPETTILILEEGALRATNAHVKALDKLNVPKEIRSVPLPLGEARAAWIRNEVKARGGAIEHAAATALAERLSGALWPLSSAIGLLIAHAGPGGRIGAGAVEAMVVADEDVNAFHLGDAIVARNPAQALALSRRMLARGMAEEQLMAMMVGRVRDWALAATCKSERVPDAEALQRLGWNTGKYAAAARGAAQFARGELPRAYQCLVIADEALKSRPGDERRLILDMLVLALATRGDPSTLRRLFPVPLV